MQQDLLRCRLPHLQFWESEKTKPDMGGVSPQAEDALEREYKNCFAGYLQKPFQPLEQIRATQFRRIRELVEQAWRDIPVYREKYSAAGFRAGELRSWNDFEALPPITKDELIAAFPDGCVSKRWALEDLFSTRSSGSSGKTLLIKVDLAAIVTDTLQGFRAFWLQTGLRYQSSHLAAHIYTVPWWFDAVGADFPNAFISSLNSPERMSEVLRQLRPDVISCYPTNLRALVSRWNEFAHPGLYGVIVHSEASSPLERQRWSEEIGVPVMDEYSSEEGTRMALELPCGHYHVHEDAVYIESLKPGELTPQDEGLAGLAVITNLLNEAMPFIRYVQGDFVTRPKNPASCMVGWSQLASIDGRLNDGFLNERGVEIPAGSLLDITYRWMYDVGAHIQEFELVQTGATKVRAMFQPGAEVAPAKLHESSTHLRDLLEVCLGNRVELDVEVRQSFPRRPGKRRPIRREFATVPDEERHLADAVILQG